jgi:hypothetical protein
VQPRLPGLLPNNETALRKTHDDELDLFPHDQNQLRFEFAADRMTATSLFLNHSVDFTNA